MTSNPLGTQTWRPILIDFLNAVFERIGEASIVGLEYLPTAYIGVDEDSKNIRQDLACITSDGRHIIVEMQRAMEDDFRQRIAFYAFRTAISSVKKGGGYTLDAVYSIVLLEAMLRPHEPGFLQMATLRFEGGKSERFVQRPVFLFVELPKVPKNTEKYSSCLEWWSRALLLPKNWRRESAGRRAGVPTRRRLCSPTTSGACWLPQNLRN